jgi:hypothetical protein
VRRVLISSVVVVIDHQCHLPESSNANAISNLQRTRAKRRKRKSKTVVRRSICKRAVAELPPLMCFITRFSTSSREIQDYKVLIYT